MKKTKKRPKNKELWQLDADDVGFSPACEDDAALDGVLRNLDAVERGARPRDYNRLYREARDREESKQQLSQKYYPKPQRTDARFTAKSVDRLARPRPKKAERRTRDGDTAQAADGGDFGWAVVGGAPSVDSNDPALQVGKRRLDDEDLERMIKRVYSDPVAKKEARLEEKRQLHIKREMEEVRQKFPKRSEEDLNDTFSSWWLKGSKKLSQDAIKTIRERQEARRLLLGSKQVHTCCADTVVRDFVLQKLVEPGTGGAEPLLPDLVDLQKGNPVIDKEHPWVCVEFIRMNNKRVRDEDRSVLMHYTDKSRPGIEWPRKPEGEIVETMEDWHRKAAKSLAAKTAKDLMQRVDLTSAGAVNATADTFFREETLRKLVMPGDEESAPLLPEYQSLVSPCIDKDKTFKTSTCRKDIDKWYLAKDAELMHDAPKPTFAKRTDESISETLGEWSVRAARRLAGLTKKEILTRRDEELITFAKRYHRSTADTLVRQDIFLKLTAPGTDGEQLLAELVADKTHNPVIDKDKAFLSCGNQRAIARRHDDVDRQLLSPTQAHTPAKIPEDTLMQSLADRSLRGGKAIATQVRQDLVERQRMALMSPLGKRTTLTSADTVLREKVLSKLVAPGTEGEDLLQLEQQMKDNPVMDKDKPWSLSSYRRRINTAELQADRDVVVREGLYKLVDNQVRTKYANFTDATEQLITQWATSGGRRLADLKAAEIYASLAPPSYAPEELKKYLKIPSADELHRYARYKKLVKPGSESEALLPGIPELVSKSRVIDKDNPFKPFIHRYIIKALAEADRSVFGETPRLREARKLTDDQLNTVTHDLAARGAREGAAKTRAELKKRNRSAPPCPGLRWDVLAKLVMPGGEGEMLVEEVRKYKERYSRRIVNKTAAPWSAPSLRALYKAELQADSEMVRASVTPLPPRPKATTDEEREKAREKRDAAVKKMGVWANQGGRLKAKALARELFPRKDDILYDPFSPVRTEVMTKLKVAGDVEAEPESAEAKPIALLDLYDKDEHATSPPPPDRRHSTLLGWGRVQGRDMQRYWAQQDREVADTLHRQHTLPVPSNTPRARSLTPTGRLRNPSVSRRPHTPPAPASSPLADGIFGTPDTTGGDIIIPIPTAHSSVGQLQPDTGGDGVFGADSSSANMDNSRTTVPAVDLNKSLPSQSADPRSHGTLPVSGHDTEVPFHERWSREGARKLARRTMDEIITRHHVQAWTDSSRRRPTDNAAHEVKVKHAMLHKLFKKATADGLDPESEKDPEAAHDAQVMATSPFRVPHPDAASTQPRWNPYCGGDIVRRQQRADAAVCQPRPLSSSRAGAAVRRQQDAALERLRARPRKDLGPTELPTHDAEPELRAEFDASFAGEDVISLDVPSLMPGDSVMLHQPPPSAST